MSVDNNYRKGRIDAMVEVFNKRFDRIEKKLDDNLEWQRTVDERLAGGVEKFKSLDNDVDGLKRRDNLTGVVAIIMSAIAGIIGIRD